MRMLFLPLFCLVLVLSLPLPAVARQLDAEMIKALRKERGRLSELAKARREKAPNPEEFRMRLLEPVIKGNQADFERNQRLVQQYRERAEAATKNRQEENAKKFMEVAKQFHELAGVNRKILIAIREYDNETLLAAYDEISPLESKIAELTGRQVPREWFTPAELAASRRKSQKGDGKWQDEKVPPAEGRKAGDK